MTELLFRDNAYRREAEVEVIEAARGRIVLDSTVFYAQGGGQPGDRGELVRADGSTIAVVNTVYDADRKTIAHIPAEGAAQLPAPGERVIARLDWEVRYKRMRAHTALHLLSVVLPYPVTGGSVGDGEGRLDFDSGEVGFDKADIQSRLEALVATDAAVTTRWITDEELAANPGLVKTSPGGADACGWSKSPASTCNPAAARTSRVSAKSAASRSRGSRRRAS